jgi:CheY-like chemotaxis protein
VPDREVRPTILVVDDDRDVLDAMAELLEDSGYCVQAASGGRAALELLRAGIRPAALVVDFAMPDVSGFDLLDACDGIPGFDDVPVLMISAFRTSEIPKRPRVLYLHKPFSLSDLLERVDRLTGRTTV